jgi:hypothetical protein
MAPMAIAIGLTHESFGTIVLAFDKAIGKAQRQKLEKGENFVSPILEGGKPTGCATRLTVGQACRQKLKVWARAFPSCFFA